MGSAISFGSGAGGAVRKTYTQGSHGFVVGDVVYRSSGAWAKAKADAEATAESLGVVDSVVGNDFSVVFKGAITGLSGLTDGEVYYLSGSTAGALTTTEPAISKPILVATGTTTGVVVNYRGLATGGQTAFLRGYIDGLILSNNVSDANNDIDIADGIARDSTNNATIISNSTITKRLDASWAAGTGNGGLDTGSKANSTWYHVYLIMKDLDETADGLFSTSATSPTMPSGYTYKRRIGAVRTDGSGNILAFKQSGNDFLWVSAVLDVNGASFGTNPTLATLTVPSGIRVKSIVYLYNSQTSASTNFSMGTPDLNGPEPVGATNLGYWTNWTVNILTNTSSQLAFYAGNAGGAYYLYTHGWTDFRGSEGITTGSSGQVAMPRGYIDGLILSNNGTDANNDIDIAAGVARDSGNVFNLLLGSSITKRLDASWAVGTNQGGLDTGSKAVSTWYHLFVISNGSTVDALFSTSATSPTMPGGYSYKRRLGSVLTDGSGNIRAFTQNGDKFTYSSNITDFNSTAPTSITALTISVPLGVIVYPNILIFCSHASLRAGYNVYSYPLYGDRLAVTNQVNGTFNMGYGQTKSNTSSQVGHLADTSSTSAMLITTGWTDPRGKDS